MKRKLLNALRVKMGWLGYIIGQVSQPFDDRLVVAIMRPDKSIQTVYVDAKITDYDYVAITIHENPDVTEIGKLEGMSDE